MKVHGKIYIELALEVEGNYSPSRPASGGSRFEPPINPPEEAEISDFAITHLSLVRAFRNADGRSEFREVSLSPDIISHLTNLCAEEITEELFQQAENAE